VSSVAGYDTVAAGDISVSTLSGGTSLSVNTPVFSVNGRDAVFSGVANFAVDCRDMAYFPVDARDGVGMAFSRNFFGGFLAFELNLSVDGRDAVFSGVAYFAVDPRDVAYFAVDCRDGVALGLRGLFTFNLRRGVFCIRLPPGNEVLP
jgi:hypothetical protein